jgi:hypothetical protein
MFLFPREFVWICKSTMSLEGQFLEKVCVVESDCFPLLNPSFAEAFRQLSQGFHGNAPGAAKQEKRLRQLMSQRKVEQRASTAGTLKTLEKVEQRQKESGTAGIKLGIDSAELEDMQEQAALLVKQKLQAKLAKKKK